MHKEKKMEEQMKEMESEIERLAILSLGIGQWARSKGDNEVFGRMMAVSRFLRTALAKIQDPVLSSATASGPVL